VQKGTSKIVFISVHIAVWICFFMLPYIFSPEPKNIPTQISRHIVTLFIVINIFLLGFYYFNTLILIPRLLFKKKWYFFILIVAGCLTAFLYAPREITHLINGTNDEMIRSEFRNEMRQKMAEVSTSSGSSKSAVVKQQSNAGNKRKGTRYFPGSYAVFLLVFAVGTSITVFNQWIKAERTRERIENEMLQTELSFLKSQINPHFFFNTLNNIYSLAVVNSAKTAPTVMKLSSIMRYILTETKTDFVPLQNEIDFIKNYIDLQQVRLTDKVVLDFKVEGKVDDIQIAPLLFIPFVENAFKYGVSAKEASLIDIRISTTNTLLSFSVTNTIAQADNTMQETTGIGMNNVKRRLQLLYPDKHALVVKQDGNHFFVHLDINFIS